MKLFTLRSAVFASSACLLMAMLASAGTRAGDTRVSSATKTNNPGIREWALPSPANAAQPNLSLAADGSLLLSWIQRLPEGGHRLQFSRQDVNGRWSEVRDVATGKHFFANWADFPAVQALPDGSLWAHTLERSGAGTYDYDVLLRRSSNQGRSWSAPVIVHDSRGGEHGFVSLWAASKDELGIAWLDSDAQGGKATHSGHGEHDGHGSRMTLRAARFDAALRKKDDHRIDAMTCDCCQTDVALGASGPLLVYRDRSEGEIRDIHLTRYGNNGWSKPVRVHADDWKMPACPVNGPAIAARDHQVWVAWYTAPDVPTLRIAVSNDAGQTFRTLDVARDSAMQGRVDVLATRNAVWMSWLHERDGKQSVWVAEFSPDLRIERRRLPLPSVRGQGRGTGFPRMAAQADRLYLVWTDIVDGVPRLRGIRVLSSIP